VGLVGRVPDQNLRKTNSTRSTNQQKSNKYKTSINIKIVVGSFSNGVQINKNQTNIKP
jgi:hypothetical protein